MSFTSRTLAKLWQETFDEPLAVLGATKIVSNILRAHGVATPNSPTPRQATSRLMYLAREAAGDEQAPS